MRLHLFQLRRTYFNCLLLCFYMIPPGVDTINATIAFVYKKKQFHLPSLSFLIEVWIRNTCIQTPSRNFRGRVTLCAFIVFLPSKNLCITNGKVAAIIWIYSFPQLGLISGKTTYTKHDVLRNDFVHERRTHLRNIEIYLNVTDLHPLSSFLIPSVLFRLVRLDVFLALYGDAWNRTHRNSAPSCICHIVILSSFAKRSRLKPNVTILFLHY